MVRARARAWPRTLDVGLLQLSVPGHSLHSPLISELYYSITRWPSRLPRCPQPAEKYTSMNQRYRRCCRPRPRRCAGSRARSLALYNLILSAACLYIPRGNGLTSDVITAGYRWPALLRSPLVARFRMQPRTESLESKLRRGSRQRRDRERDGDRRRE